jgi:hypothetical protein
MATTRMVSCRTTFKDIAIATICLAANIAIGQYNNKKPTPSIDAPNVVTKPFINVKPQLKKFTSLPIEIRKIIYEHAMCFGGHFSHPTNVSRLTRSHITRDHSKCLPAVCFTNKVERIVATSVFLRYVTFRLFQGTDAATMTSWLERLDSGYGFTSVRNVELCYVLSNWPSGFKNHFELLRRCPGVRELTVIIPLETLNFNVFDDHHLPISARPLTYIELQTKFQIAGILECAHLRNVTFKIESDYNFDFASRLPLYSELTKLIQLIKIGFANRHQKALNFAIMLSSEPGTVLGNLQEL